MRSPLSRRRKYRKPRTKLAIGSLSSSTCLQQEPGNVSGLDPSKPICSANSIGILNFGNRAFHIATTLYIAFAFAACTTAFMLFGLFTPSIGVVYLGGLVLIACQLRNLLAQPGALFLALLFPLFALCSTLWGVEPETTFRHAVQLGFTVLIGASIGCALQPHKLIQVMSVAFVGLILLSVANLWLQVVPAFQQRDYLDGNEYFTGIYAHKNTFGMVLCLGALCLSYFALISRPGWPYALAVIALLPIFLFTRSTTSIVLYACILCMPIVYYFLRLRELRVLILLVLSCSFLLLAMLLEMLSISLIDIGLELAGKGRDMSGRTSLWATALGHVSERPWFGVGYQSFWTAPRFAGEVNQLRGLLEPSIGHFHNAWLEVLVGIGIFGLMAFAALPVVLLFRFLRRLWQPGAQLSDVAGLFFVLLTLFRANVEISIYVQHQTETLVLIALLFSTSRKFRAANSKTANLQTQSENIQEDVDTCAAALPDTSFHAGIHRQ